MTGAYPARVPAELRAAAELFNGARYLAAHELFEELWEASEGQEANFYKGLIQASIALHHFQEGNGEGASKLYRGHRRYLAAFVPQHRGLDLQRFLEEMTHAFRPLLGRAPGTHGGAGVSFDPERRPRLRFPEIDPD